MSKIINALVEPGKGVDVSPLSVGCHDSGSQCVSDMDAILITGDLETVSAATAA